MSAIPAGEIQQVGIQAPEIGVRGDKPLAQLTDHVVDDLLAIFTGADIQRGTDGDPRQCAEFSAPAWSRPAPDTPERFVPTDTGQWRRRDETRTRGRFS
ncbi:hypothetical protein ASF71_06180 [Deinococcus sp. Leaf326]|nr:hypothetical protein ASF71_06180 [Deinococcus sp. Leaf326]